MTCRYLPRLMVHLPGIAGLLGWLRIGTPGDPLSNKPFCAQLQGKTVSGVASD